MSNSNARRRKALGRDTGSTFSKIEKRNETQESHVVADGLFPGDSNSKMIRSLRPHTDGTMTFGAIRLTPVGIEWPENRSITQDVYSDLGRVLFRLEGSIQWMIGDWLNYGENHKWGETIQQIADELDREISTIYKYKYVSSNVDFKIRIQTLSFGHHQLVAPLRDDDGNILEDEQSYWLQEAAKNNWSVSDMRKAMRGKREKEQPTYDDRLFTVITKWIKESDPVTVAKRLRAIADQLDPL